MRLGVIICPQCKYVKGVNLTSKTTKCTCCGKTLQLKKLKVVYETESQETLRQMIGFVRVKQKGKADFFKDFVHDKHE